MKLNMDQLAAFMQQPSRFEPGEIHFWDDPHIAQQMLATHLNPEIEAASRHPQTIKKTVEWMIRYLGLKPGDSLLDLGCGPGLYSRQFSAYGLKVTGVDLSENSLRYARQQDSTTTYLHQNYLDLQLEQHFDVTALIYGDFCVLSDEKRSLLLQKIHQWTKRYFVLDVTTLRHHLNRAQKHFWSVHPEGGFWKPTPHLVLFTTFDYPETDTVLEQYVVVEESGKISIYRNWFQDYSPETITAELEKAGFQIEGIFSDLMGTPFQPDSEWLGVVASPHR